MMHHSKAIAALIACTSIVVAACSSDNGPTGGTDASAGGSSEAGGSSSGGKGNGGASSGGKSGGGGTSSGGSGTGGASAGGSAGKGGAATGGSAGSGAGGSAGSGAGGSHATLDGGADASSTDGGDGGLDPALVARGSYLVNAVALCGGCHTDGTKPADVLGGNATFRAGLPAPNLTSDATGLGTWTNAQIKEAFMNGIDNQGQPLSSAMPYQFFHNLTDADADAIVAYLRSLTHVVNDVGERTVTVTAAATPFPLSVFPDTTLHDADAATGFEEAEAGRYLLTSAAQCARCHSPTNAGAPDFGIGKTFTGGAPNPNGTPANQYAPNITPDATGIGGWTADDVVTLLKTGKDKAGNTICGPMRVGPTGGYGKLTDADAHAIGVYLTTIPAVANSAADPDNEPACP